MALRKNRCKRSGDCPINTWTVMDIIKRNLTESGIETRLWRRENIPSEKGGVSYTLRITGFVFDACGKSKELHWEEQPFNTIANIHYFVGLLLSHIHKTIDEERRIKFGI